MQGLSFAHSNELSQMPVMLGVVLRFAQFEGNKWSERAEITAFVREVRTDFCRDSIAERDLGNAPKAGSSNRRVSRCLACALECEGRNEGWGDYYC